MITIKTLDIEQSNIGKEYANALKNFVASFHSSIENMVSTKDLTVGKLDFHKYKPAEQELAYFYEYDSDLEVSLNLDGFHREVFGGKKGIFNLPGVKGGEPIKMRNLTNSVLLPLVRDGFFDDEYLMFIKPFLHVLPIVYNKETNRIGFSVESYMEKFVKKNSGESIDLTNRHLGDISNTELLKLEVEQGFINKEIGDPDMGFGFTHKIRQLLGMKFYYWQKQVIKGWNKINVIFAVRNSGKTAFACYIGLREIVCEKNGFGIRKNRKIIYFVPDKVDIGEQIMDYMEGYIDAIFDSALEAQMEDPEYLNADDVGKETLRQQYQKELTKMKKSYFKIERSKYSIKCNITGNSLKVVSLQDVMGKAGKDLGTSKGEGLACDVYIVEEAPRIPDAFWKSFWERAETESDYGYISGTLNKETPKNHWTYKLAIRGELGDPDITTHRIALPNNENLFHGLEAGDIDGRKEIIERERVKLLEDGIKNLYCRGYGIILDESKVFNVTGNVLSEMEVGDKYHYRVIVEDFGGDSDPIGFVVYNINTQMIEKAVRYKGLDVNEQIKLITSEKAKYKNCYTLGDGTGWGRMVRTADINSEVEYYITFTSGPEWKYNKDKGYYSVDKSYMVDLTKEFFDKGFFKIFHEHEELLDDIDNFVKITNSSAKVQQYEAKRGKTDDLVACLLMIAVFITKGLGLIEKEEFEKYGLNLETNQEEIYNQVVSQQSDSNTFYNGMY